MSIESALSRFLFDHFAWTLDKSGNKIILLVPADGGGGGSATEKALLAFGAKNGLDGSVMRSQTYNRVGEIPFSSERKYMAVQCVKSRYGHYHANFPPCYKTELLTLHTFEENPSSFGACALPGTSRGYGAT